MSEMANEKLSIIWNLTRSGPWNSKICCVDAICIPGYKQINNEKDLFYSYPNELNFFDKLKIVDQLSGNLYRVVFSGGELLIDSLNIDLVIYASQVLGSDNVGISNHNYHLVSVIRIAVKPRLVIKNSHSMSDQDRRHSTGTILLALSGLYISPLRFDWDRPHPKKRPVDRFLPDAPMP